MRATLELLMNFSISAAYIERFNTPVPTLSTLKLRNKKEFPIIRSGTFSLFQKSKILLLLSQKNSSFST